MGYAILVPLEGSAVASSQVLVDALSQMSDICNVEVVGISDVDKRAMLLGRFGAFRLMGGYSRWKANLDRVSIVEAGVEGSAQSHLSFTLLENGNVMLTAIGANSREESIVERITELIGYSVSIKQLSAAKGEA